MNVEPQKEHLWLQRMLGTWNYEHEAVIEPNQPPVKFSGTETVRTIGEVWVMCEGQGQMPGGGIGKTVMTLGFDTAKQRFVGTFYGSMMTNLWIYDGSLDPAGKVLTLEAEGPNMADPGKPAMYQDMIEFHSDDHRTLTSRVLGEDGMWHQFMTAQYHRSK